MLLLLDIILLKKSTFVKIQSEGLIYSKVKTPIVFCIPFMKYSGVFFLVCAFDLCVFCERGADTGFCCFACRKCSKTFYVKTPRYVL